MEKEKSAARALPQLVSAIQRELLPEANAQWRRCSPKDEKLLWMLETLNPARFLMAWEWKGVGRPPQSREKLFCGFIAKAVYKLPTTKALIERLAVDRRMRNLCGWSDRSEVPSETTFSRTFAELAQAPKCWSGCMRGSSSNRSEKGFSST